MKAILQVADTGPMESLLVMLTAAGVHCFLPDESLRNRLRAIGCDTVLDPEGLVAHMGYQALPGIQTAGIAEMQEPETVVFDVKAHRNGPKIKAEWPSVKVAWYRINGGRPTITPQGGDEVNLAFPILTPNLWYAGRPLDVAPNHWQGGNAGADWGGLAYTCWPPFNRAGEYAGAFNKRKAATEYAAPVCLIHNVRSWGYGMIVDAVRTMGVLCYGSHGSPDGLVQNRDMPDVLGKALALVHLKSNDCPGYALYEAMAAGCPVVIPRRLIRRMNMGSMFEPGENCLVFDEWGNADAHGVPDDPIVDVDCVDGIRDCLRALADPDLNLRIGNAGRERLRQVCWSPDNFADVDGLRAWLGMVFQ